MSQNLSYNESAECWFRGDLGQIPSALGTLGSYLAIRGVNEETWKGIELAVAEALNNAVIHGCKDREDEGVLLQWNWSGETLVVTVHDPSQFMPEFASADLPEDPLAEEGRGHFLMATLMDEVAHLQVNGHHALEMKKKLGPMSWSPHVLADYEETLNSLVTELGSCYENLSAVFRFSEILATATNFTEFSETVLDQLNRLVKAQQSYLRLQTQDASMLWQVVSVGEPLAEFPLSLEMTQECLELEVFKTRVGKDFETGSSLPSDDPLHPVQGAIRVCPIFFQQDVLGCLAVLRPAHGHPFLAAEAALIRVVADFLGIAYVAELSKERSKQEEMARRELEIASSIQQSLLPNVFPEHPPYQTFGICRSAREVGGDYFDLIPLENRGLLLVIADVMGKGMPAALLATIFRTAVRARLDLAGTPGQLLTEVNRQLASDLDNLDMFITAKLVFLSYEDHMIHYADAGHCPILIRRKNEPALLQIQADGFPLGVSDHFEYPAETFQIEPGDVLTMITDGVYEGFGEKGLDYLMQQILKLEHRNLPDWCNRLLSLSEGNVEATPLRDDRTILVLERKS